ncbi:hypothetical protein DERP_007676 [Dermatophagoides pteronyssinus]|uniref:Uncharacterized protein n=1 Tax=Dermatophagoides pteronyssinus TaxID=6956 RepID=A0ABQ8JKE7_DERPT|nr:hypothetical protein DERP_007676 [Dermatophagoides pteronyssinus]
MKQKAVHDLTFGSQRHCQQSISINRFTTYLAHVNADNDGVKNRSYIAARFTMVMIFAPGNVEWEKTHPIHITC